MQKEGFFLFNFNFPGYLVSKYLNETPAYAPADEIRSDIAESNLLVIRKLNDIIQRLIISAGIQAFLYEGRPSKKDEKNINATVMPVSSQ